jgi:hypothetical protein
MPSVQKTAIELFKETSNTLSTRNLGDVMFRLAQEKGFSIQHFKELASLESFGPLTRNCLLRHHVANGTKIDPVLGYFAKNLKNHHPDDACEDYRGSSFQNIGIDGALSRSTLPTETGKFYGQAAGEAFYINQQAPSRATTTPIAIIGAGAAGTMVYNALRSMGFSNIDIYEKSSKNYGIWGLDHVANGTRNNPRNISFQGQVMKAAPGTGREVRDFLSNIYLFTAIRKEVKSVGGSSLNYYLTFADGTEKSYPIVINCLGLGKPAKINDPKRMTTSVSASLAGERWQTQLTREAVKRNSFAFIGLGNSTMEMIQQLQKFEDEGIEVDYKIFTHYPNDSVNNPDSTVEIDKKKFRMFRDLQASNLVDLQGDLPATRVAYFRALREDRIVSGVSEWDREDGSIIARDEDSRYIDSHQFDRLFTLIGYKHEEGTLQAFGCVTKKGEALYDYDGEMHDSTFETADPDYRLKKGLFGFGAILDSSYNRNAIVIPGMVHRIGDLAYSVMFRAMEYNDNIS